MDFFAAQEEARRKTGLLVFYFLVAVVLIVIGVYLALWAAGTHHRALWNPALFSVAVAGTLLLVGGGAFYKMAELAEGGGASVAESLGGRLIARSTGDPADRRLLNVVEEMAIASGVPVPPVYLLAEESSINAFAAGDSPANAVIAVTRGALEQLSRDELQGVVAHEFSHVLNGDMRLNMRLMGVLFGILLLALIGRGLLSGTRGGRGRNAGAAVALGLALLLIGYVGVFFGRLIKAAVSRQREFLADAAAVQFTRNPAGIAGALKKLAGLSGSRINHPRAEEASHLFFGEGLESMFAWFATHPPLEERIRRIEPSFVASPGETVVVPESDGRLRPQAFAAAAGTLDSPHLSWAQQLLADLPPEVVEAVRQPNGARYVIYGLLLSPDAAQAATQLELVREAEGVEGRSAVAALRGALVTAGQRARLPLVDMALPVLQWLDPTLRERFVRTTQRLVRADRRIDLFEYTLQHIFARRLGPGAPRAVSGVRDVPAIREDCALLLSALAWTGNQGEAVQTAFDAGAALAPLPGPWDRLPPQAFGLEQVDGALRRLSTVPPRFKQRLVEACAAAVACDGRVTEAEAELLRAVCEALEVPMPPLLL